MDWRDLNRLRGDRGPAFYLRCLEYAQQLWRHGLVARSILCLDRALFAELQGSEAVLAAHPLPYAALAWMLRSAPGGVFLGNPRAHYQHLADRVRGRRAELRGWRAWACWHIVRVVSPGFSSDPRHAVREPEAGEIRDRLAHLGHPGEPECWQAAWRPPAAPPPDRALRTRAPAP